MPAQSSARIRPLEIPARPFSSVITFVTKCASFGECKLLVRRFAHFVEKVPGRLAEFAIGQAVHHPANSRFRKTSESNGSCVYHSLLPDARVVLSIARDLFH